MQIMEVAGEGLTVELDEVRPHRATLWFAPMHRSGDGPVRVGATALVALVRAHGVHDLDVAINGFTAARAALVAAGWPEPDE
jgi:hypothetical protein